MDTLTHAVSGALVYKGWTALTPGPKTRWALPLAMLVATAPDVDIFFAPTPIDFLLLHRGITHALAALPVMTCLMALLMYPFWRRKTPEAWSFAHTCGLACCLIALHIYLDCITTYGTMIFLPFSDYRVRLNGMFIVDIWLLIPMIFACFACPSNSCATRNLAPLPWRKSRRAVLCAACIWVLAYPACTVLWRQQIEAQELISLVDEAPFSPTVLPDALSPLHWRILYATEGLTLPFEPSAVPVDSGAAPDTPAHPTVPNLPPVRTVHQQALSGFAAPLGPTYNYPAANPTLVDMLAAQDRDCKAFFHFTLLPLQYSRPWEGGTEYLFYDLRFNTLVPFVQKIMSLRRGGAVPFLLRVRFDPQGSLVAVRMSFSGSNRDSDWHPPAAPQPPTWAEWLVGLQ